MHRNQASEMFIKRWYIKLFFKYIKIMLNHIKCYLINYQSKKGQDFFSLRPCNLDI